jgi:hypothetical protein
MLAEIENSRTLAGFPSRRFSHANAIALKPPVKSSLMDAWVSIRDGLSSNLQLKLWKLQPVFALTYLNDRVINS